MICCRSFRQIEKCWHVERSDASCAGKRKKVVWEEAVHDDCSGEEHLAEMVARGTCNGCKNRSEATAARPAGPPGGWTRPTRLNSNHSLSVGRGSSRGASRLEATRQLEAAPNHTGNQPRFAARGDCLILLLIEHCSTSQKACLGPAERRPARMERRSCSLLRPA